MVLIGLTNNAQSLPNKVIEQPDGITVEYFDKKSDECHPSIFIGDSLQILFRCYSKDDYYRIDISKATVEMKRLRQLVTQNFIQGIGRCCERKHCNDTAHGYYLMNKKGDKNEYIYLDINFVSPDKCGSDKLNEIIELLDKINKNYR